MKTEHYKKAISVLILVVIIVSVLSVVGVVIWKHQRFPERVTELKMKEGKAEEQYEDCGTFDTENFFFPTNVKSIKVENIEDYEEDKALVCWGKNILNGCKNSKIIVDKIYTFKIEGADDGCCKVKIEIPTGGFLECPISKTNTGIEYWREKVRENIGIKEKQNLNERPGYFAALALMHTINVIDKMDWPSTILEAGCTIGKKIKEPESFEDCGIFNYSQAFSQIDTQPSENDEAFACFQKNFLDSCKESKLSLIIGDSDKIPPHFPRILEIYEEEEYVIKFYEDEERNCRIRLEFAQFYGQEEVIKRKHFSDCLLSSILSDDWRELIKTSSDHLFYLLFYSVVSSPENPWGILTGEPFYLFPELGCAMGTFPECIERK